MIGTKGLFRINPRWAFGWNVLAQSDKDFSNTYGIIGFNELVHRNEVFLTGLNDRNYFDLRAMHFQVQEEVLNSSPAARNEEQPWVLPTLDYSYTPDEPVDGGRAQRRRQRARAEARHSGISLRARRPCAASRATTAT